MARWKTTENIFKDGEEFFDENWMNYNSIYDYIPPNPVWKENRPIRLEDVEIWEVISEWGGPSGIYAAWSPFAHYFIVVSKWSLTHEFWGLEGEKKLKIFMKNNNLHYSEKPLWIDDCDLKGYLS